MLIIPSILSTTFQDFAINLTLAEGLSEYIQIDIMDGVFVPNNSFPDIEKINNIKTNTKFELHLMVQDPLEEIEKWNEIKNVFRIVFHIEAMCDQKKVITKLRGKCLQVGIALNPETSLENVEPYLNLVDEVLFMTVHPGKQGNAFMPEMKTKIRALTSLSPRPIVAVDGGINESNIAIVKSWGVDVFCVGSTLFDSEDIREEYLKLCNAVSR